MKLKKLLSLLMVICLIISLQPLGSKFAFAAFDALDSALNVDGGTLDFTNDAVYSWVVDTTTHSGRTTAASNITGLSNTTTTLTLNAGTLSTNKVIEFEWNVISEYSKDILYFIVNGTPYGNNSGQSGIWETFKYVIPSQGSYTFTWVYSKDNAYDGGADTCWIDNVKIVNYVPAEGVSVSPLNSDLNIGFTEQLTAEVFPSTATYKTVSWASDNESVATVNSLGVVTGKGQGLAHIIATTKNDGGIVGEANVNVLPPVATTGVTLNYSTGMLLVGDTGALVATITPALASYRTITWTTTSSAIASVDTAGKVTGKAEGTATIIAHTETGGFYAQCVVTVITETSLQDQTHLAYTPVSVGSTTSLTFDWQHSSYVLYSRPPLMPATTALGFSVYLTAGQKVSFETGGSANVDTYLDLYDSGFNRLAFDDDNGAAGFSFIDTYFAPYTGTYYLLVSGYETNDKGTFNLYVTEVPPVPVTGVSFNQDTFSVPLDHTLPLSYTIMPGNADYQGVTFDSSNESSIMVNAAGEVTGVAPGSSVITITTVQGGFTDTCVVSVGYTPVTSISYDTDAVIVGLNKTKTLQYTIEPAAAQLRGVAFTSNNLSVATVDAAGIVTAVGLGNAVITVTTDDCDKTDTCSVKVVEVNVSTCASVTLEAGDVWGDGTGYQLLLDAHADAYGRLFQKTGALNVSGDVPSSVYNQFEQKIPVNADGVLTTTNIVVNNSITILIPAGVYDYCITNPVPNKKVWIANTVAGSPGRYDNFNFQAGYSYKFVITSNGSSIPSFKRDITTLTYSYTGAGLNKYSVDYTVSGTGGTLGGKTHLDIEEGYTLTAADLPTPIPDAGRYFLAWNPIPVGTEINGNKSFTASFAIHTYTVTFKDWNETVLKTQTDVPYGTAAAAPALPNNKPGYNCIGWDKEFSFVSGNLAVKAVYEINKFAVNLPTGQGFTAIPEGTSTSPVNLGGNFTFRVALGSNYSHSTITVRSNGTALTPVQGVYTISNITAIQTVTIDGVVLNNAIYTALDAAIAMAPDYADSFYTTVTIDDFRNAVTAGQGIDRNLNVLSQNVIDAAAETIVTAYENLELKPAVYTALDAALSLIPVYNEVYYTETTLTAFNNTLSVGQSLSRSLNIAQQATIDNAAAAINSAYANLVLRPDPTQFSIKSTSSLAIERTGDLDTITGFNVRSNNVANIISQFDNFAVITIEDVNGVPLGSGLVGTGAVIKLLNKDGIAVERVTVIVYGDTDCNGLADGNDATIASLIAGGMLTEAQVGEVVYNAADANHDGLINNADVALLEQSGLFLGLYA